MEIVPLKSEFESVSWNTRTIFSCIYFWDGFWDLKGARQSDRSTHRKWVVVGVGVIKRGVTGRWRSGRCGFFNLPDASRWQRLITRWHGAVMFTLSHLFVEAWAGQGVCAPARWFNVTSPPSGQGVFESGERYLRSWGHPLPRWGYYTVPANPGEPSSVYLLVVGGWAITHLQRGMGPYLSPSTGLPPLRCVQQKDFLLHYCVSYSLV